MNSQNQHPEIMRHLSKHHDDELLPLIMGSPVQYLDIPVYNNIGDLLIYHGTLAFLKKHKIEIRSTSSKDTYISSKDGSVLLLQGGGNLGDLWPEHQLFRERIIENNSNKRIIILPQSIHFQSCDAFRQAEEIMQAHPDLHLFVRDHRSLEIGKQLCENTKLMPDMAHQLYPIQSKCSPRKHAIYIKRSDKEARIDHQRLYMKGIDECTDWSNLDTRTRRRLTKLLYMLHRCSKQLGMGRAATAAFAAAWELISKNMIRRTVNLFSEHDSVVTDRLHAHILASLMNIPNTVHDNSYGKNSSYIKAWTEKSPLLNLPHPPSPSNQAG